MEPMRIGSDMWIPCEVQPGTLAGERRVYLKINDDVEWFGFVSAADIREDNGRAWVRATIIGEGSRGIIVKLRGHSMGTDAIQAPPEVLERYGAIAA